MTVNIIKKFLSVNQYSRPGRKLAECKAIILHYVGINNGRAHGVWNYFENDCPRNKHYSSTQYIIDLNGDIIHAVPDNEVAYHCGSSLKDPESGRVYTDWARKKFRHFVEDPTKNNPNNCTIGIELCIDRNGDFTPETLNSAIELVAKLLKDHKLNIDDIGHHKLVVGWKDCPLPFVKNPEQFEIFKDRVREKVGVLI